jgi:tetratricopeptide (TPR) repeat protein
MARDDWFRNQSWNRAIEADFFARLGRAMPGNRAQYLRIQACTLSEEHPVVALRLLEQYFSFGDRFDLAQAYVDQATAFLSLGEYERAVEAYESALAAEARRPNVLTGAIFVLPLLIARRKDTARYSRALALLQQGASRLTWPLDHFHWHAAHALIDFELGKFIEARERARAALEAASQQHSGFRYHSNLGLVGRGYDDIRKRLTEIIDS